MPFVQGLLYFPEIPQEGDLSPSVLGCWQHLISSFTGSPRTIISSYLYRIWISFLTQWHIGTPSWIRLPKLTRKFTVPTHIIPLPITVQNWNPTYPGGPVNLPVKAGDMGLIPGQGRSHMPGAGAGWGWGAARLVLCTTTTEGLPQSPCSTMRSPCTSSRE